ncbi:ferric-chelate reductase-like protein [Phyllosticta citribraziliensis]|uniref:Ferric-chelate reductase-like protein n=1 Tax=Phyllosticta citribraziliensis TaxID=989973 RepID=A0ABR1MAQ7_9PEZI
MAAQKRHIQDMADATTKEHHWGYADRAVPCTSGEGTCAYLDAVYWMMDVSMLYTFILWAVIGGILFGFIIYRLLKPRRQRYHFNSEKRDLEATKTPQNSIYRLYRTTVVGLRKWLLPETLRSVFGRVSRLQVLVLVVMLVYLLIFSLVGIVYKTWVTPVKGSPGVYNTRSGLGGFADRVGALAYALTPLTVGLATRESILSLLTGIPYQHFMFLHRWTGRIIFIQSFLHTLGWTIVEGKLYQPQPSTYASFMAQQYIIFGVVAMLFITYLYIFSIKRVIQWTGYEFFRKTHYIVAALYLGACWGHWTKLACWMIASIGIMFLDRGLRLGRILMIHMGYKDGNKGLGFRCAQSNLQLFQDGDTTVIRLDFVHNHEPWQPGQHFYLCFPALSIWQSHPMTPSSVPAPHPAVPHHTYIIRAEKGETRRLAELAEKLEIASGSSSKASSLENGTDYEKGKAREVQMEASEQTTPVILTGPYGEKILHEDGEVDNMLAIAGGTGISFTLPIATAAISDAKTIDLVWIVRKAANVAWIAPELLELKAAMKEGYAPGLRIKVFVTRDAQKDSEASSRALSRKVEEVLASQTNFSVEWLADHHPSSRDVLGAFVDRAAAQGGRCQVVASGPAGLGTDLRSAVAERCDAGRVWKGEESADLELYWDNRSG